MQGAFGYYVNAIQKRYVECMNPFCCKISECGGCWGARIFQVYKIGVQFGPHTTERQDVPAGRTDMRHFMFAEEHECCQRRNKRQHR